MSLAHSAEDTLDAAAYSTTSITASNSGTYAPDTSAVYVVRLVSEKAGGSAAPTGLAGWSGTWAQVHTVAQGNFRLTTFWGVPGSATPGALTGTWAAAQDKITLQAQKWTDAYTADPVGSKDTSTLASGTSLTNNLSSVGSGHGVSMGLSLNGTSGGMTPGADMQMSGAGINMASYRHDELYSLSPQTAPSASWVNTRAAISDAIEIRHSSYSPPAGSPKGEATNDTAVSTNSFSAPASGRALVICAEYRAAGSDNPTVAGMGGTYRRTGSVSVTGYSRLAFFEVMGLTGTGQITSTYPNTFDAAAIYVYPLSGTDQVVMIGNGTSTSDGGASDTNVSLSFTEEPGSTTLKTIVAVNIQGAVTNFAWGGGITGDDLMTPSSGMTLAVGSASGFAGSPSASWTTARLKVMSAIQIVSAGGMCHNSNAAVATLESRMMAIPGSRALAWVASRGEATDAAAPSGLSGLGGSWSELVGIAATSGDIRLSLWQGTGLSGVGPVTVTWPSSQRAVMIFVVPLTDESGTDWIGGSVSGNDGNVSDTGYNLTLTAQGGGTTSLKTLAAIALSGAVTGFSWTGGIVTKFTDVPHADLTVVVGEASGLITNLTTGWTTARYKCLAGVEVLASGGGGSGGGGGAFHMLTRR